MDGPPTLFLVAQIALPLAIGIGGGWIAFAQWRIAKTKVAFDLFDRRMQLFDELQDTIKETSVSRRVTTNQTVEMQRIYRESRFLFDSDVSDHVRAVRDAVITMDNSQTALDGSDHQPTRAHRERITKSFLDLMNLRTKSADVFLPHMMMRTKPPQSFWQWIHDLTAVA